MQFVKVKVCPLDFLYAGAGTMGLEISIVVLSHAHDT